MSWVPCRVREADRGGRPVVRLGHPQLDRYLDFVSARARPNTVLATGYDLEVFFSLVSKEPAEVTTADVLAMAHTASTVIATRTATIRMVWLERIDRSALGSIPSVIPSKSYPATSSGASPAAPPCNGAPAATSARIANSASTGTAIRHRNF